MLHSDLPLFPPSRLPDHSESRYANGLTFPLLESSSFVSTSKTRITVRREVMLFRTIVKQSVPLGAAVVLTSVAFPSSASEVLSEADARSIVEQRLKGDILKIEQKKIDGRVAYAVTVMNAGGNANHAYQVYTLVIDGETGTLVPQTAKLQPNQIKTAND